MHTLRTVDDALALREATGSRAVVLGAGFIGIEAAEALAARGFETYLVELAEHVLPPLEVEMATLVAQELRNLGVHVHAGVAAQAIAHADNNDVVTLSDGKAVPVAYRMMLKNGRWVVYDVLIENVSLIKNYRSQFQDVLSRGTPEQLIDKVEARARELQAQSAVN